MVKYALPGLAALAIVFATFFVTRNKSGFPDAPPPIEPSSSPYGSTVAGAGVLEALTENIAVGAPLPGVVLEVMVKVGQQVSAGDGLFRVDDRAVKAQLELAQAALQAAEAELHQLENRPRPEEVPVLEAQVREAEAGLANDKYEYERIVALAEQRAAAEAEIVRVREAYHRAQAHLAQVEAQLALLKAGAWKYELEIAQANVTKAKAEVQRVQTDLDRLTVRALVDGEVLQVNVRPGQFVASPSMEPLMLLGSTDKLHVRVDIDEYDIPRFQPGSPAKAKLKGYSQESYDLEFVRVEPYVVPKRSLTGENTERVDTRVLQVIYKVDPTGRPLYVGQQVDVFIEVSERN